MERLLVLRLHSHGCAAEARLNDIAVARTPAAGGTACVPVHEFVFEGENRIALVVDPVAAGALPAPRIAGAGTGASLRLLLPRVGAVASEASARSVGELDWAADDGEIYTPPVVRSTGVALPIKFPRWRWLDAPTIDDVPAAQPVAAAFVQSLAVSLAKGDPEPFLGAARVRFEDLSIAYQQAVADLAARWRSRVQLLHATKALKPVLPTLADVVLRPCAGGRLLECVSPTGEPALRTEPATDGAVHAWPIRISVIQGRCHIVR